jgi:lipopolysaccharide export system protein LptA
MKRAALFLLLLGLGPAAAAPKDSQSVSILPGSASKSPISIDADKLNYFEKEGRAIYDGHVVVVQGDTRLTCSKLTIFMETSQAQGKRASDPSPAGADASSRLKHMDCEGPVTVRSKTQTATADSGAYDKGRNDVVLTGHVVLTDGRNVTKGDRLVYDLASGQAAVQGGSARVHGLFLPGSTDTAGGQKKK